MSNRYRLQLLSHGTVFETREEAVAYINEHFKEVALWAEPALFFYGNPERPKMILAVGATTEGNDPTVYIMDDGKIKEIAEAMENTVETLAITRDDLLSIVTASGLTFDENHIQDRVEYHPNINDDVIKNATTIAEAVEMVSAYAQEVMAYAAEVNANDSDTTYRPVNSGHTVRVSISEPEENEDGKLQCTVSADVKVSEDEFNMLEVRDDRLFVPKISGGETTTTETTVTRDNNGGYTVKTNINLSDDHTIVVGNDGGLSANIDFTVDSHTNKMRFVIGDQIKEYAIPGFSVIDSIEYDSVNNDIVIKYYTSDDTLATVRIPIENVFDVEDINETIAQVRGELADEAQARETVDNQLYQAIQTTNTGINGLRTDISTLSNNQGILQSELDTTQIGAGLGADGSYVPDSSAYFISGATSLKDADNLLDRALNENLNSINNAYTALNSKIDSVTISKVVNVNPSDPTQYRLKVGNSIKGDAIVMPDISLVPDTNAERTFNLMVDGVNHGSVVIPEDQDKFLSSAAYDVANHELVFVWNDDAQTETRVPLDDLIDNFDPYTAGDGVNITNNVVSVKLSESNSNLLEIVDGALTTKTTVATESEVNDLDTRLSELETTVSEECYTQAEAESDLALKADKSNTYTKANVDLAIDGLRHELSGSKQNKLSDSDTIEIVTDNSNGTTANVKIKHTAQDDNNVLKSDSQGLFVNVSYNNATNTLTFNDKQITLAGASLVKNVQYDAEHKLLVLTISEGSTERQISVPLSDLVDTYTVDNTNTNVELSISNDNKISANAIISSLSTNALTEQNNGLYVSNSADDYTAHLNDENMSVQDAISSLNGNINDIFQQFTTAINDLGNRLQQAEEKIANLESIIAEIVGDGEYEDFASYGERITRLEEMTGDYNDFQGDNDMSNDGF